LRLQAASRTRHHPEGRRTDNGGAAHHTGDEARRLELLWRRRIKGYA
jgi:hypothetical protein